MVKNLALILWILVVKSLKESEKITIISMTFNYPLDKINNININNFRNNDKIFICFYKIISNAQYQQISKPFIKYLLFKYPKGNKECLSFPFTIFDNKHNPTTTANKFAERFR